MVLPAGTYQNFAWCLSYEFWSEREKDTGENRINKSQPGIMMLTVVPTPRRRQSLGFGACLIYIEHSRKTRTTK